MSAPPPQGQVQTQSIARMPVPGNGTFVTGEQVQVQMPIDKAASVIDAALSAGAIETYALILDTTMRESLYRQALAKAVADARSHAEIVAKAAGMSIVGVQEISSPGTDMTAPMEMMGQRMIAIPMAGPMMSNAESVQATIEITYRIK
jgi:hypothetical protein